MKTIASLLSTISARFSAKNRTTISSPTHYLVELIDAIERNRRLGLGAIAPKPMLFTNGTLITQEKLQLIADAAQERLGLRSIKDVASQCLSLHFHLLPILEEVFCCPVYYTIGYVEIGERTYYGHTEAYLEEILKTKDGHSLDIHAWLTLPSGEILDATFATTFAAVNGDTSIPIGALIADEANVLRERGLHYRPTLVGEDFLFKAGLVLT